MEKPITISPEHQLAAAEAVRNFYAENGYVYSELVSVLMPGADEDFAYQVAEDINLDGIIDESLQNYKKYGRHCEAFRQNLAHSSPFTARVNRLLPDAEYSGAETVQLMRAICSEKEYHPFPLESAEPIPTPQLIVGAQNTFSTGNIRWDWYIVCMLIHTPCDGGLFNGGKDAQSCEDGIKAAAGCLDYIESNFKTRWWQTAYYHINKLFEKGCAVPTEVSRMFEETLIKDLALFSDSWLIKQKLATYFIAVGRPLEAVPYIKDYLDAAGPKKGCYFLYFRNLLGVAYYKAGKYDEALAVFKRLAEADKSNRPMIYYNIAACYVQMGDFDSALTYLEKIEGTFEDWALKVVGPVDVKDEETYLEFREKSVSLFKDNNSKGALVYALKAVLLKSDDNILQYNVGVFYKQDDHAEKAVPYLERAAQLIPKIWVGA
ncbi:MAG: tetratricopeptide repeat protein [Deltaproteobacteria bacterium]|nr:tetratricopeptide repeat protein [Deltaproteobacteria bacterium]